MNAPLKSARLCSVFLIAFASAAWADYSGAPGPNYGAPIEATFRTVAPDYSIASDPADQTLEQATPAPEAATIFLCGAGILIIFAGIGIRRTAAQKSGK